MLFMKKTRRFLSLDEKSYFVRGLKRGAIYDLKRNALYSLDENLASLFSWSLKGLPYPDSLQKIKQSEKLSAVLDNALKNLPFVKFRKTRAPVSPRSLPPIASRP